MAIKMQTDPHKLQIIRDFSGSRVRMEVVFILEDRKVDVGGNDLFLQLVSGIIFVLFFIKRDNKRQKLSKESFPRASLTSSWLKEARAKAHNMTSYVIPPLYASFTVYCVSYEALLHLFICDKLQDKHSCKTLHLSSLTHSTVHIEKEMLTTFCLR